MKVVTLEQIKDEFPDHHLQQLCEQAQERMKGGEVPDWTRGYTHALMGKLLQRTAMVGSSVLVFLPGLAEIVESIIGRCVDGNSLGHWRSCQAPCDLECTGRFAGGSFRDAPQTMRGLIPLDVYMCPGLSSEGKSGNATMYVCVPGGRGEEEDIF